MVATRARCSDRLRQNIGKEGVGERGWNRTFNLLIKSQLLCQLSYAPLEWLGVMLAFRSWLGTAWLQRTLADWSSVERLNLIVSYDPSESQLTAA